MGDVSQFQAGWSIARLADEFSIDRRTATKRIRDAGIAPFAKRGGHDVYRMVDVAAALLGFAPADAGGGQVVDPRDLPPMERRAFYQSENERLKVEQSLGTLVPAAEVEADYADLVKTVVQFMDTLPDVLERDCSLSPAQVVKVQEVCDDVRMAMFKKVTGEEGEDVRDSA